MNPYWKLLEGDSVACLRKVPARSVHCIVTSPPYWGLRLYDADTRMIGMESTPKEWLKRLLPVFRECRRVLRDDGTLFVNMGDAHVTNEPSRLGLKHKDLIGLPWMLAFALRAMGFYLRMDNIWEKSTCTPESMKDRCTKTHEYIFHFSKSARYFYDAESLKELASLNTHDRGNGINPRARVAGKNSRMFQDHDANHQDYPKSKQNESWSGAVKGLVLYRNKRSVWKIAPQGFTAQLCMVCDFYFPKSIDPTREPCPKCKARCLCGKFKTSKDPAITTCQRCRKSNWASHYATFPEELARTCIEAGTSQQGCCAKCGKPLVRILEKVNQKQPVVASWDMQPGSHNGTPKGRYQNKKEPDAWQQHNLPGYTNRNLANDVEGKAARLINNTKAGRDAGGAHDNPFSQTITVGWRPQCSCNAGMATCVVLDPFSGAGTTGIVALALGRSYIGIELANPSVRLQRHRIIHDMPLFNEQREQVPCPA